MTSKPYRVGGSLRADTPTYVTRQADRDRLAALCQGEFCYVFEARQMGKSSLLARVQADLQQRGVRCVALDMTAVGGDRVAPSQWYYGIFAQLWCGLGTGSVADLKQWWQASSELSFIQRLSQFMTERVLVSADKRPIAIFIDEIDSALSLPFAADDFFAWIRWCYNQRALNPAFQRLRFALFGVATPADLIRDKTRTPFTIGTPIALSGFTLAEAAPLAAGLDPYLGNSQAILAAILRGVWALAFSRNGETLGTATDSGAIALWNLPQLLALDELTYACDWLRDYLQHHVRGSPDDRQLCPETSDPKRSPCALIPPGGGESPSAGMPRRRFRRKRARAQCSRPSQ